MKKQLSIAVVLLMALVLALSGCQSQTQTSESSSTSQQIVYNSDGDEIDVTSNADTDLADIEVEYSDKDLNTDYDKSTSAKITLSDGSSSVEGSGASVKDDVVTISQAGTYILTGTLSDGQLVVDTTKVDVVNLVFDGVSITNKSGSAVYIKQAEKVIITLADGSQNYAADSKSYADTGDDAPDAAIYAGDDLTINGTGSLTVVGSYENAVKTVDDLVITGGTINITAASTGLRGKDSVSISGGDITIKAQSDAIKSDNSEDEGSGWVSVDGGTITISAGNNGIQGETGVLISDGIINITASEDSLHCNGSIRVSGGELTLASGDDGIHADNSLDVTGGQITVVQSYEGLEGAEITISGGVISVAASDDGLNAAGGSDTGMANPNDRFRQTSEGEYFISISGGTLYINASGDGIDSNGDIYISGGTIYVDGPASGANSAIDEENSNFVVTGSTLAAAGTTQMLVMPTDATQPVVTIIYNQAQSAGSQVIVTDSNGNQIISITPAKTYQCLMLSSPEFELSKEYTITYNNQYSASFTISSNVLMISQDGSVTQYAGSFTGGGGRPSGGHQKP